jgi:hypothetical protein
MATDVQMITAWLTHSGTKIIGILVGLVILSQVLRWSVRWVERLIPEKNPLYYSKELRTGSMKKESRSLTPIASCSGANRRKKNNAPWAMVNNP